MNWRAERVAVIGAGRSGRDSAIALQKLGAQVEVFDRAENLDVRALREKGIPVHLGRDVPPSEQEWTRLIVSPGVRLDHPVFEWARQLGIPVWGEIELAYRIARAPIIAITGTNGKTTTTALTHHLLIQAGLRAHLCGNIAGSGQDKTLVQASMEALPEDYLVAEVSSFQLVHIEAFRPYVAVLTNIAEDHLDYHGSWEAYALAKANLFRNQTDQDWAILNACDEGTRRLMGLISPHPPTPSPKALGEGEGSPHPPTPSPKALGEGEDSPHPPTPSPKALGEGEGSPHPPTPSPKALGEGERVGETSSPRLPSPEASGEGLGVRAKTLYFDHQNPIISCKDGALDLREVEMPALPGVHGLQNALAAALVASVLGATRTQIAEGLRSFRGVPHRMERLGTIKGVLYINNSMCTNAPALEQSLQVCPKPCIVIAGGVDKNNSVPQLAESLARHAHFVLLIGQDGLAIGSALSTLGYTRWRYAGTLSEAVQQAHQMAEQGMTVILAPGCASFDQFRNFQERGDQFRALVQQLGEGGT